MKFKLSSDLHLEFERKAPAFSFSVQPDDKETTLILAGDISTGVNAVPFVLACCKQFERVVMTLGNHEFYAHDYNSVRKQWRKIDISNFILLDNDEVLIDNVRLVGGTLWTDFDDSNWFAMNHARRNMNDFYYISYAGRVLLPEDTVLEHKKTLSLITETVAKLHAGPTVVVTHHLPHPLCVDKRFAKSNLNPAFMSNLNAVIQDNDIAVWCHGHTHSNVDVKVHGTRILCNPRGYAPHDLNAGFNENFTFEV
jgi:predicted phosphodiesterase